MKKTTENLNEKTLEEQPTTFNYIVAQEKFDKLQTLKQDHVSTLDTCNTKEMLVKKLQLSLEELVLEIQWKDKEKKIPMYPQDGKKYKEFKSRIELASQELQQATDEAKQKGNTIADLEKELKKYEYNIPALEVVTIQKQCKDASEKVDALQCAILDQENIKEKASSSVPSMQDLDKDRENLLAKITLGEATTKDLNSFDKKYAKEQGKIQKIKKNSKSIILSANQTIAGLQRRLTNAETQLNTLITQKDTVQLHFLRSEIEKTGDEYSELANSLIEKYKRILGLEGLMRTFITNPKIRGINYHDFRIPTFSLRAFGDTHSDYRHGGFLPKARLASQSLIILKDVEKERISKLGIDLG